MKVATMYFEFHVEPDNYPELKEALSKNIHIVEGLTFKYDPLDGTWFWSYGEFTRTKPVAVTWTVDYIRLVAEVPCRARAGSHSRFFDGELIEAYVEKRNVTSKARVTVHGENLVAIGNFFHDLINGTER